MFSSNTIVAELLDCSHQAANLLIGLHVECIGCSMNKFCTLDEMCRHYDLDLSLLAEMVQGRIGINHP